MFDFGDVASGIAGLANTAYNLYTNKRDFDYQKALQQTMFEREDTAVQRRMADLKAAGLNPNLAAGSAAGAGSVVSRSTTNDVNIGAALDTIAAKNQIKMQNVERNNALITQDILKEQQNKAKNENALDLYTYAKMLGIPNISIGIRDNHLSPLYSSYWFNNSMYTDFSPNSETDDNYVTKNLNTNLDYLQNQNSLLEKQLNWYTANQIADMITGGLGAITGTVNAGANLKRASSIYKHIR